MHKEECWRRLLGCASGGDFGENTAMCTRKGVWEGLWDVHQEGCLGRMVGMCTKTGGLGCVHSGAASSWQKELQQDCVLQRFALPLPGVWRREEYFICTTGFKWWLLNHYWRLVVGSMF